jgi:acyl-CoA oxidase
MIGGLTTGRMLIAQSAIDSLKVGCVIAIRYALKRPQFRDKPIMAYVTHQLRLLPALANAYALHLTMRALKNIAFSPAPGGEEVSKSKQLHVMTAGIKAASTWLKVDGLQKCRECCGGQGFLSINKIGPMAVDTNVDATFEGDNTVMMQQVSKGLAEAGLKMGAAPPQAPHVTDVAMLRDSHQSASVVLALLQFKCAADSRRCMLVFKYATFEPII